MHLNLNRGVRWAAGLFLVLVLDASRCGGLPPVTGEASEIRPAIMMTEGTTKQGFPYLFGGVSSNEREAMEERASDYNLKLVFAEKNGSYLSGVAVTLSSAKEGEILAAATQGPWFYIRLPAGVYNIKATFNGQTKQITNLRVAQGKATQQIFVWDLGIEAEP